MELCFTAKSPNAFCGCAAGFSVGIRLGGGKAAEIILSLPEKLSFSANRAAKPQECSTTNPVAFLQFNRYEIHRYAGRVSREAAVELAETEYEKFPVSQDRESESDFDWEVKKLKGKK